MEDRTYAISTRDVSTDPTSGDAYSNYLALTAANVTGAESIGGVPYFANAFDTRTDGLDIVATSPIDWAGGQMTTVTASMNYNKSEFDSDPSAYLNAEDTYDFEHGDPEWRGVLTLRHSIGALTLMGRANMYGPYDNSDSG